MNLNWDPYERQKLCRLAAVVHAFRRSALLEYSKHIFTEQESQIVYEAERTLNKTLPR